MVSREQANKNAADLKELQKKLQSLKSDNSLLLTKKVELFSEIERLEQTAKLVDDKRSNITERVQKTTALQTDITRELNKLPGSVKPEPTVVVASSGPPLPPPPPLPKSSVATPKKIAVKKSESQPKDNVPIRDNAPIRPDAASLASGRSRLRPPRSSQPSQDNANEEWGDDGYEVNNEASVKTQIQALFSQQFEKKPVSSTRSVNKQKEQDAAYQQEFEEEKAAVQKEIDEATSRQLELAQQVGVLMAKLDATKESQQIHEKTLALETDFIQQIDTKTEALMAMHRTVSTEVTHELSKIAQKEAAKKAAEEAAKSPKESPVISNKAPPPPPPAPPPPPKPSIKVKSKSTSSNAEIKKSPDSSGTPPSQAEIQKGFKAFQEKREQQATQDYLVTELVDMLDRLKKSDGWGDYTEDQTRLLSIIGEAELDELEQRINNLPEIGEAKLDEMVEKTLAKRREFIEDDDKKVAKENPQIKKTIIDFIKEHPKKDELLESTKTIKKAKETAQAQAAQEMLKAQLDRIEATKEENQRIKMEKIRSLVEKNAGNSANDFSEIKEKAELKNLEISETIIQQQKKLAEIDQFISETQADLKQRTAMLVDAIPSNPLPAAPLNPQVANNEEPVDASENSFEQPIDSPKPAEEIPDSQVEKSQEEIVVDHTKEVRVDASHTEIKTPPIEISPEIPEEPLKSSVVKNPVQASRIDSLDSKPSVKIIPPLSPTQLIIFERFERALETYQKTAHTLRAPGRIDVDGRRQNLGLHMNRVYVGLEVARDEFKKNHDIKEFIRCSKIAFDGVSAKEIERKAPRFSQLLGPLKEEITLLEKTLDIKTTTLERAPSFSKKQLQLLEAFDKALESYKKTATTMRAPGRTDVTRRQQQLGEQMLKVDDALRFAREQLDKESNIEQFIIDCETTFNSNNSKTIDSQAPKHSESLSTFQRIINSLKKLLGFQNNAEIAREKQTNIKEAFNQLKDADKGTNIKNDSQRPS